MTVAEARIENNQWTLYDDKVSWLSTSAQPSDGNVIIYAHNRKNLFGSLAKVSIGDDIFLEHLGKTFSYTVKEKNRVLPTSIDSVVSNENRLTLYTCDGAFDQKRLVIVAIPGELF